MSYLVGEGRRNEHTEPHLVAGDDHLLAWYDDNELDHQAGVEIGRYLEEPSRVRDVQVSGGHVWHSSLSLRADEGQLTDEQWGEIARRFVAKMDLDDAGGTKSPTRWVAVRHGVSSNGNDHVHVAVNLVREDGTKARTWNDRDRAQKACRALEHELGLQPLHVAGLERGTRGQNPAEVEAQARRVARARFEAARRKGTETRRWAQLSAADRDLLVARAKPKQGPRPELARTVRGCAAAAADEAEFVRRLRRGGVLVRARYAEGTQGVVTGYSVALRPPTGERPIWYGGGSLGRDLTLPRLRQEWPDSIEHANAAWSEWEAAKRHRRPVAPGRETRPPEGREWVRVARDLDQLREQLRTVPANDPQTWARLARQTSGALAAWSQQVEKTPGPLAHAADELSRSAQLRARPSAVSVRRGSALADAAWIMAAGARGGNDLVAQAVLLRQMMNLSKALHDMHAAQRDAAQAARIEASARHDLAVVASRLPRPVIPTEGQPEVPAAVTASFVSSPRAPGSPLPSPIRPARAPEPSPARETELGR